MRFFTPALMVGVVLANGAAVIGGAPDPALRRDAAQTTTPEGLRPVVVAVRALSFDHQLTRDDLAVALWPERSAPKGAYSSIDALLGAGRRIGPRTATTLAAGAPVLRHGVKTDRGFWPRPAAPEALAMRVPARLAAAAGARLRRGDQVDVLLTRRDDRGPKAEIFLRDVAVMALGGPPTRRGRPRPRSATLAVPAAQAQRFALAMQVGALSVAPQLTPRAAALRIRRPGAARR